MLKLSNSHEEVCLVFAEKLDMGILSELCEQNVDKEDKNFELKEYFIYVTIRDLLS